MTHLAGVRGQPGACKSEHRKPLPQEAGAIPTLHPHTQGKARPSRQGPISGTPCSCIQVCLGKWQLHWNKRWPQGSVLCQPNKSPPPWAYSVQRHFTDTGRGSPCCWLLGGNARPTHLPPGETDSFYSKGSFLQKPALKEPPPESLHSVSLKPR